MCAQSFKIYLQQILNPRAHSRTVCATVRENSPKSGRARPTSPFQPRTVRAHFSCSFTDKCTAIALALTMIERSLLGERPVGFIDAPAGDHGKNDTDKDAYCRRHRA